jgi:hypothetical protein
MTLFIQNVLLLSGLIVCPTPSGRVVFPALRHALLRPFGLPGLPPVDCLHGALFEEGDDEEADWGLLLQRDRCTPVWFTLDPDSQPAPQPLCPRRVASSHPPDIPLIYLFCLLLR